MEAVQDSGAAGISLKWPNDLMAGDAKLAGILVESRGFRPKAPHFVVGFGLNIAQRSFSEALTQERAVTSLFLLGIDTSWQEMEAKLLEHLPRRLEQARLAPLPLFTEYFEVTSLVGARVQVQSGSKGYEGKLLGLTPNFELRLHQAEGEEKRLPIAHVAALVTQR